MGFPNGKKALASAALASALMLGGCYGDGYGYGGISAGYGGYDDGYYGGGPYGYGGGYPTYGWYDGFYYPGNGYYVYDRGGGRQRWNDGQRRHWEGRRGQADGRPGDGRWQGRPDRPRDGRWAGNRPGQPNDPRWQGRPDGNRPDAAPGTPGGWIRPDRAARADPERARADRGQGVWGAFPRAGRDQTATPGLTPAPRERSGDRGGRRGNRP